MALAQKEISVSEFFAKNRHLLGFDNPRKALLTTVKEAVDNSLDACEEAGILPEIWVQIDAAGPSRYRVAVQDNGPGIVKKQIPNIYGKLLYGSKFHRLRMSRGQQGIGISAAGMYGLLTTGKPIKII
ncbi:MAG: ATP-binding protein, partial [Thermoguttaceae bacterium]|nr:ATP-binding protein [Thermoguttaceae bacterium]